MGSGYFGTLLVFWNLAHYLSVLDTIVVQRILNSSAKHWYFKSRNENSTSRV